MNKFSVVREIYMEAFKSLGHLILRNGFKIYFWTCAFLFLVVVYAFSFRLATGFVWD